MNKYGCTILFLLLIFFTSSNLIGQEVENIELGFRHPYSKNAYLRIVIRKDQKEFKIYKYKYHRSELLSFFNKESKRKDSLVVNIKKVNELKKMIYDFDSQDPKNIFEIDWIQDPRQFDLSFKNDGEFLVYSSVMGQRFKTNDKEWKLFNEICKKILRMAKISPNKTIR